MPAPEDTAEVGDAIAGARPTDPAGLLLARARVESALFGAATGTGTGLGRFHVLERLGRGGMGVVYAAYDPELDRGVALKMIHVPERGRELAVAEAKALAKLSHPNVVPVFDVGVLEDHVYIVMELVRGATLRDWVKKRPVREIVEVYLQAGAALAAAHAAGLVHRDFKPDNALVGSDGRVRVVDFGLACEASAPAAAAAAPSAGAAADAADAAPPTDAGGPPGTPVRAAGTPRYMAPEQAAGTVSPAADQYSFCVSLDEALRAGEAAPPRWLSDLVARGRAPDPAARFPSMQELLRALGRDPARVRRRRLLGAAALASAAAAAFLVGRARAGADEPAPCSGGAAEIAAAWPRAARAAQLSHLAGLGPYGADLAARLGPAVDAHATRWAAGHRAACLAHRRGEQSAALLDRRMVCLARSRDALAAVAELVAGAAPGAAPAAPPAAVPAALPDLARALAAVPDPDACADTAALATDVPPPPPLAAARVAQLRADLERARVQIAAGRTDTARAAALATATEAAALGYAPLAAEAQLTLGHAALRADPPAAAEALAAATRAALASRLDAVAIEAWARRAWVDGTTGRAETALAGLDVIEALAARTPSPFARALLHNNAGSVELARGRRAEARAAFEQALREARGVTGPGAVELVAIRRNLALVLDDPAERDRVAASAQTELARLLGPSHPDALMTQYMRAGTSVLSLAASTEMLAATCERFAMHERLAPLLGACFAELADVREEQGDRPGALAAAERAAAAPGVDGEAPEAAGYTALWRGDPALAARRFEAALAALAAAPGAAAPGAPDAGAQFVRAKLHLGHARALRAAGRLAPAAAALDASLAALDGTDAGSPVALQRRLGRARAELAEVLAATGGPPARIRELAAAAAAWYQAAGAPARQAALAALTTGSP